ncbi:MAG: hypothetical protein ACXAC7_15715 [Candidatus Hodarchaeales archaeon]|jgi:transcription initiation factor TFIIIB Brf1 subunit/transcription initiation factor TFIIB
MSASLNLCEECGTPLTETISDYVCPACGLIQSPKYVQGTYMSHETANSFGNQYVEIGDRPSSVSGTGSYLDYYGSWKLTDIAGKRITPDKALRFARLKKINDIYTQSRGKEKLYRALQLLNRISGVLELPNSLKEESAKIYRLSYQKIPGKVRIANVVGASIYLATRMTNYNLRIKEMLNAFQKEQVTLTGKKLIATAAQIRMILGLQVRATRPEEYLERVIVKLHNNEKFVQKLQQNHISHIEYAIQLRKYASDLLKRLCVNKRGGRDPYILAGATVAGADLIISRKFGKKRGFATQRFIAEACDIPEYTLREHFIKIVKKEVNSIIEVSTI